MRESERRVAQELEAAGVAPAHLLAVQILEPFTLGREIDSFDEGVDFIGTCQSCGAYWDVRQRERCPSPCGGYIG